VTGTGYPTWEETQLRNLERFDQLITTTTQLAEIAEELRKGMAAIAEVMATQADLDDLRLEVREATSTHSIPPELDDAA